jgi:hypothetical protein
MDLLVSRPPPGDQDKVDAEEDGSVLQLLVLTPTEEGPRLPTAPASRPRIAAALVDKCLGLLMCLLALRIPCFFIVIGIAQVRDACHTKDCSILRSVNNEKPLPIIRCCYTQCRRQR